MNKIKLDAILDNLDEVLAFVDGELEKVGCSMKVQMQIDVAVEEIFVNIASYAYGDKIGSAEIITDYDEPSKSMSFTFIDQGTPYDPLAKEDPDVTLSAEERQIGGLGIYIVKKSMDDVKYEYKDNSNILTLVKKIT